MSLHWAALVHEKVAIIAAFAYSQVPLTQLRRERFQGGWRFLEKVIFDLPRRTATQACMDLALYFRVLDDDEGLTDYWKQLKEPRVGTLFLKDGATEPLSPREMSNKIIHAERIEWELSAEPKVICIGRDKERWVRAEIEVESLLALAGQLGS
jgi:hypothetical protein